MLSRWFGVLVVVAVGSSGCDDGGTDGGGGTGGGGGDAPAFAVCKTQHTIAGASGDVIVCDEAFEAAPFVHLPPPEAHTEYMAMLGCAKFVDRAGVTYDTQGLALCNTDGGTDPDRLGHAFAIYRVTLDADARVEAFERYAIIDEKNLLAPFANAKLEGLVSKRDGEGMYELAPTLPIRVSMGAPTLVASATDGTSSYEIAGNIENVTTGVRGSDGSCIAALAGGASEPFPSASNVVLAFSRVPSMHAPGDDEAVFDVRVDGMGGGSTMSPVWYFGPEVLIASTAPNLGAYGGTGHGTPGYIPSLRLSIVHGGGGACKTP